MISFPISWKQREDKSRNECIFTEYTVSWEYHHPGVYLSDMFVPESLLRLFIMSDNHKGLCPWGIFKEWGRGLIIHERIRKTRFSFFPPYRNFIDSNVLGYCVIEGSLQCKIKGTVCELESKIWQKETDLVGIDERRNWPMALFVPGIMYLGMKTFCWWSNFLQIVLFVYRYCCNTGKKILPRAKGISHW